MAENPTIFQRLQLGKQTVFGTPVAATRRLGAVGGTFVPHAEVVTYKPTGFKFTTVAVPTKEWSEVTFDQSAITYDEIVYLLDSLVATATPTGNGTTSPYVRVYEPSADASQVRRLYTVEHGSGDRARKIQDAVVSGLAFDFNRGGSTLTGSMLGKAMEDDQTLTASLDVLPLVPVAPIQVSVKFAATQAGLAAASAHTRDFGVTFSLANFSTLVWPLNGSIDFAAHVETVPEGKGQIILQVNAAGMAPLANMRAGSTLFMRIGATGPQIAGVTPAAYHGLQIDVAMKITGDPTMSDHEGTYVITWNYEIAYDGTWGKACALTVTNGLAAA